MITREEIEMLPLASADVSRLLELHEAADWLAVRKMKSLASFDFRTNRVGGTSALVYDDRATEVSVSLGAWTVVNVGRIRLEFSKGDFNWSRESLRGRSPESIMKEVFLVASHLTTPEVWTQVFSSLRSMYLSALLDGVTLQQERFREVLGI
jgi:hypothetical protein